MQSSIVLVFTITLFLTRNGVCGRLKCNSGMFHDKSSPGITVCRECSTCPDGTKTMSDCGKDRDTVCCTKNCGSDAYLDLSSCVCRQCTRTCPANYRLHGHCGELNDARCVREGVTVHLTETSAMKIDPTPSAIGHKKIAPVIDQDADATPTAGFPTTTVGQSKTTQPRRMSTEHVTHAVSTSQTTSLHPGNTKIKSTAGVTSRVLTTSPLWIVTVVLGGILVVTVASLLVYCKITMTCRVTRKPTRSVGVAQDQQWRMQPPLNNLYADHPSLDVGSPDGSKDPSPEARSGTGVPGSTSIGSFGTSSPMTNDEEDISICIAEWECEPATTVWKSSAPLAEGRASEGRGGNAIFYPRNSHRPSMSMSNVFPAMSPSPSNVWIDENGRTKVYNVNGNYVNGGVHCCHQHHVVCEHQQVCHHTTCMHDDCFLSSTFSIGSLGSGCTV